MRAPFAPARPTPAWAAALLALPLLAGCAHGRPAAVPVAPAPPAQTTAVGGSFRVVCHFDDAELARTALRIAETAERVAAEVWAPIPPSSAPRKTLDLHLYRTIQDFDLASEALTREPSRDNLNFFSGDRLEAHILLQPMLSDEALRTVGFPFLTKSVIAFQATQLLRAARGPGWQSHPAWFSAGLGKWVTVRTLQALGAMTDPARDPLWSSNIHGVQQVQRRLPTATPDNTVQSVAYRENAAGFGILPGRPPARPPMVHLPSPREVLARDLPGTLTQNEFFGVAWLMFETLMSPRFAAATRTFVADLQTLADTAATTTTAAAAVRLGGLKRITAGRIAQRARDGYGADTLEAIDADFYRMVAGLTPHWDEPARSLDTAGSDWTQIAFPQSLRTSNNAQAWSLDRAPAADFAITGQARMLPNFGHQMNIFLEIDDNLFLQVGFVAGQGITFLTFDRARNSWAQRGHAFSTGFPVGTSFPFRVAHVGQVITVDVFGQTVARVVLDRPPDGRWGLGVYQGTAGIWSNLHVAAVAAPPVQAPPVQLN